ncbi:hypothetical protein DL98DRAFT_507068 [Cadophora sp. DSE1049]|nr:hypothetical protein DL98DRAFT_507068 [Cadophora sp. DSE1049]
MSSRGEETSTCNWRQGQRRAPAACNFCRHRKMKCDNDKPVCRHCRERARDCLYAELVKKPRPSSAKIAQLEEEIQRLREKQSATKDTGSVVTASCRRTRTLPRASESTSNRHIPVARPFAPDRKSGYHGPTSTVFEDRIVESVTQNGVEGVEVPDLWVKWQLVAESARQRQRETVNLIEGSLDFDSVDPDLGMELLSIYWNRQHCSGPLVYRTTFMRDMACAGPNFSKLLLNAIYFYSCKYSSRQEVRQDPNDSLTAGWAYRQRAADLLSRSFDKSEITTIQALLIMSSAIFTWCDEKSTSWLYSGLAINMIYDLGIHADASNLERRLTEEELEGRRRLFWAAYVIDKMQSLYQGRPARLRNHVADHTVSFLDDYEELELFSPLSYTDVHSHGIAPTYSISTFREVCRLSIILEKILQDFYAERAYSRSPSNMLQQRIDVEADLCNWRQCLLSHIMSNSPGSINPEPLPHVLSLLAMYNVAVILLHRPFVSGASLHSEYLTVALDAFSACTTAAFEVDKILRLYEQSFCLKATPYIISYATYASATIHARTASQNPPSPNAHKALQHCLHVLEVHESVCWSAKRAKRVVDRLIADLGVVLDGVILENSTPDFSSTIIDINEILRTFSRNRPRSNIDRSMMIGLSTHSVGDNIS